MSRYVYIVVILYIVIFCWILYYFLAVHDSLWLLVILILALQNINLSNFNIIPLLHIILNFVGQHHTSWIFYIHLYIIMAIFKEFMHCVNTPFHSQILHLFQFADEMSDSHIYKYSQNNLLRKIHISENRKNNCTKIEIPRCKLILWL